jgi:hypothetical protein
VLEFRVKGMSGWGERPEFQGSERAGTLASFIFHCVISASSCSAVIPLRGSLPFPPAQCVRAVGLLTCVRH